MNGAAPTNKILRADPEHGGIRIAVILTIVFSLLGAYLLIRVLLGWFAQGSQILDFATIISCVGAIPVALGCAWLVERYLKITWSSGLEFQLTDEELRLEGDVGADGSKNSISLDLDKRINVTRWYFRLIGYPKAGRERLVPDKWLCLAYQMQQDDKRIVVFTYAPPDRAEELINNPDLDEPFQPISLAYLYKESGKRRWGATTRPDLPSDLLAGEDGRYWIAERRRWDEGLELTADDFVALVDFIEKKA